MLLIILLGIAFALGVIKYRSQFKGFENVNTTFPGPRPLPIIGNALMFWGDSQQTYKAGVHVSLLYRKNYRFWIGPLLYIMIMDSVDIEAVLSSMDLLEKLDAYDYFLPWIGRGLLTSFGSKWKKHRKALTPAFHFKILDGFLDVFNKNTQVLLAILEKEIGNKSFNVMYYMKLCALDNICETAMGVEIDAQNNPNSDYVKAIKKMCKIIYTRCMFPWYRIEWLFNMSYYGRAQTKALKIIHGLSKKVVENRIQTRKEMATAGADEGNKKTEENDLGIKKKRAFLDLLLDLADEGSLSVSDVLQEVDTFMFEGHDTITSALSFALYSLANNPKYQEKAFLEQKQIFGEDERVPTTQDLQEMKYLEMVIKEALRLYPSVPLIGRSVKEDMLLNDSNILPKGCNVVIPIVALHLNPDVWEKSNEFYPDHFLPEASMKRHPFAYIPFSAGPRNCIGMRFAMTEMKCIISQVLRRYELIPALPNTELVQAIEVVLISKSGFPVAITKRMY